MRRGVASRRRRRRRRRRRCCCCCLLLFYKRGNKVGFPLANFLVRSDLFPLSVSLITSGRRGQMDADQGKRSLGAEKFTI
jgi:hypothetical protein